MMGFAVRWPAGSIRGATTPGVGGLGLHDPRRPGKDRWWCSRHRRQVLQGAHMAVAQGVEHELQLAPGSRDTANVPTTTLGHSLSQHPDGAGCRDPLDRLDRRPADKPRALLGDPPTVDMGIGLVMLGRQASPAGQLRRRGKPGDVADLGHEHRSQGGTNPGDALHRGVARLTDHSAAAESVNLNEAPVRSFY